MLLESGGGEVARVSLADPAPVRPSALPAWGQLAQTATGDRRPPARPPERGNRHASDIYQCYSAGAHPVAPQSAHQGAARHRQGWARGRSTAEELNIGTGEKRFPS